MLKQIHVAETEDKALANAAQFRWMQGEFTGLAHPVWSPLVTGVLKTAVPLSSLPPAGRKTLGTARSWKNSSKI